MRGWLTNPGIGEKERQVRSDFPLHPLTVSSYLRDTQLLEEPMKLYFATLLALAAPSAADVLDVRGPSPDYQQISDAVTAAVDGDLIRVWPGNYAGFSINDKTLTVIRALSTGTVQVNGACLIENLSPGRHVEMTGISASGKTDYGLHVRNSQGSVRVREGQFWGANDDTGTWDMPWAGVRVDTCKDVELVFCTAAGGSCNGWYGGYGENGVSAYNSTLSLFNSTFSGTGGSTGWDAGDSGGDGGHGVSINTGCLVFISGCTLVGGDGSDADPSGSAWGGYGSGGNGGWGIKGMGKALVQDVTFDPGQGGSSPDSSLNGNDGQNATHAQYLPGKKRILRSSALLDDSELLTLRFVGVPGDRVYLITAAEPGLRFHPVRGPFLVASPPSPMSAAWRYMGQIDQSGVLTVTLPAPQLNPLGHTTLHFQGAFMKGKNYFGSSSWSAILDTAW